MTHWLLPFSLWTEREKARKASTPADLKATLAAFKNKMLKEHLLPQAHSQLKKAGVLTSGSTLLNLLLVSVPTPPSSRLLRDCQVGLVVMVPFENIKWVYT